MYSEMLRHRTWADAIIRSPVSCQTWKSCTSKIPSIRSSNFFCSTSTSIVLGTVCSRIKADSMSRGHTPRIMIQTRIKLNAEKQRQMKHYSFCQKSMIFYQDQRIFCTPIRWATWYTPRWWPPRTPTRRPSRVRKRPACSFEIHEIHLLHRRRFVYCLFVLFGLQVRPQLTLACPRRRRWRPTRLSDYGYHGEPAFFGRHVSARDRDCEHVHRARGINKGPGGWLGGPELLRWGYHEGCEYLRARRIVSSSRL